MGRGILGWEPVGLGAGSEACGDENTANDSMESNYCQGIVLDAHHSN